MSYSNSQFTGKMEYKIFGGGPAAKLTGQTDTFKYLDVGYDKYLLH